MLQAMTKREAIMKLKRIRRDLLEASMKLPLRRGGTEEDRPTTYAIGEHHTASAVADLDRAMEAFETERVQQIADGTSRQLAEARETIENLGNALWEARRWGDTPEMACWCPTTSCRYASRPACVANEAILRRTGKFT